MTAPANRVTDSGGSCSSCIGIARIRLRDCNLLCVLAVCLTLLTLCPDPAGCLKKGMFKRKDRGDSGGGAGGGDGPLGRSWPWDSLNASELENRSYEYQIKAAIMDNYQKVSRPVLNDSEPVVVYVGFSLFHILDTDEKYQTMKSLISVRLRWTDHYLQWDADEFGNTTKIWISASNIWLPDILISNYADDDYREMINTNAIVSNDGTVLWMYPMVTKTYCEFDIGQFPFDSQICNVSFFSWTFGSRMLDLHIDDSQTNNNFYNPEGQEWFVERITNYREVRVYVCCKDDKFPNVHYGIHMRRRSLFYILNLIFPCLLIYSCSLLGFFLPVESGEKVNLEITILLALVVFLIIAGEVLPPTPDVVPILGLLYGTSMLMVSVALVMAVIVTNLYSNATRHDTPVPPRLLRLSRIILFSWTVSCAGTRRRGGDLRVTASHALCDENDDAPMSHQGAPVSPLQRSLPASARNLKHMATHDQQHQQQQLFFVGGGSQGRSASSARNNTCPGNNARHHELLQTQQSEHESHHQSRQQLRGNSRRRHFGSCPATPGSPMIARAHNERNTARSISGSKSLSPAGNNKDDHPLTMTCFCTVECETAARSSCGEGSRHQPTCSAAGDSVTNSCSDWQVVSSAADRVFFWVFLVSSCLIQAYIFGGVSVS